MRDRRGICRARRPFRRSGGRRSSSWRWMKLLVGLKPSAIMRSFLSHGKCDGWEGIGLLGLKAQEAITS